MTSEFPDIKLFTGIDPENIYPFQHFCLLMGLNEFEKKLLIQALRKTQDNTPDWIEYSQQRRWVKGEVGLCCMREIQEEAVKLREKRSRASSERSLKSKRRNS